MLLNAAKHFMKFFSKTLIDWSLYQLYIDRRAVTRGTHLNGNTLRFHLQTRLTRIKKHLLRHNKKTAVKQCSIVSNLTVTFQEFCLHYTPDDTIYSQFTQQYVQNIAHKCLMDHKWLITSQTTKKYLCYATFGIECKML